MKGFSLIEVLVYCALFSVVMGSALTAVYELEDARAKNEVIAEREVETLFLERKIAWAVRQAGNTAVDVAALAALTAAGFPVTHLQLATSTAFPALVTAYFEIQGKPISFDMYLYE